MSYLALARKWRPRSFDDVMGQGHVVKALSHALSGDRLHPAILLTGTRGVGKTTLARIIAKCLNCETGVSAAPCGICSACREVDEGRFVDLLEIDAASNTGVDDVRQVIDNAQYAPARGRYKVYLIDEVHMLSKSAFNALLKTLEEPPPHVKFILATTDPQKLPVTVLSRCLQFNLKRLTVSLIRDQLAKVLDNEGIAYESAALLEIARGADGSMRDGLSLLDQAIAFSGGQPLAREPIEDMLGTSGRARLFDLLGALADGDSAALLASLQGLEEQAPDYAALISELAAHLQRIAVFQLLPGARNDDDEDLLWQLKDRLRPEDVQLYYQIAVLGRRDLPWAPDPRLGFEMSVLRMAAFRPDDSAAPAAPSGAGGARGSSPGSSTPVRGAAASSAGSLASPPRPDSAAPMPATIAPPMAVSVADDAGWAAVVDRLAVESFVRQLARHCAWSGRDGETLRLELDGRARHLLNDERRGALEQALGEALGGAVRLQISIGGDGLRTPARLAELAQQNRVQDAETAMRNDPVVRAFREQFGASIKPGSIHPLDS